MDRLFKGGTFYAKHAAYNTKTKSYDSGWERRLGWGAKWESEDFLFAYGGTVFSGLYPQQTGFFTVGHPDYNLTFDNDVQMFPHKIVGIPLGDGGDRYRSSGVTFQFDEVEMGLLMFTGDPGMDKRDKDKNPITGQLTYKENENGDNPDSHRLGAMYFGTGGYRLGYNEEEIRNVWQNKVIHKHMTNSPFFKVLNVPSHIYGGRYTKNPFTTW